MTICIAALCENRQACVVAADRMAVFGSGTAMEFMRDDLITKIFKVVGNSLFLHSGNEDDARQIVATVNDDKSDAKLPLKFESAAERVMTRKRDIIAKSMMGPEMDFASIVKMMGNSPGGPLHEAWQQARREDSGQGILVTQDGGMMSAYFVMGPVPNTRVGLPYVAIGSGGVYARAALTIQGYSEFVGIAEAMFQVYAAKKAAELVYGVGKSTNMTVVKAGSVHDVTAEALSRLEELREKKSKQMLTEGERLTLLEAIGVA